MLKFLINLNHDRRQYIDEITRSAGNYGIHLSYNYFSSHIVDQLIKLNLEGKSYKLDFYIEDNKHLVPDMDIWQMVGTTAYSDFEQRQRLKEAYEKALDYWEKNKERDGHADFDCPNCHGNGYVGVGDYAYNECECVFHIGPKPEFYDFERSFPKKLKVYACIEVR